MNGVLKSIEMMHHQFVLIVNGQTRLLDECFRNRISRFDAAVCWSGTGVHFHRSDRRPNQPGAGSRILYGSKKRGKGTLVLRFSISPSMHSIVEVHQTEPNSLRPC